MQDILTACCGLKGFPEAIEAAFPQTVVQTCIVHLLRNSRRYVSYKDQREISKDLKPVYTAADRKQAEAALEAFDRKWGERYPLSAMNWEANRVPSLTRTAYTEGRTLPTSVVFASS